MRKKSVVMMRTMKEMIKKVRERREGFTMAAYLMMTFFIISFIIGIIWAPKTQGKTLEEITRERYGDNI